MRALFSPLSTLTYWRVRQLPPACAGGSHTRAAVGASTAAHSHGSVSHALRELARARPVELRRRPALAATSYPRRDARWLPHARVGGACLDAARGAPRGLLVQLLSAHGEELACARLGERCRRLNRVALARAGQAVCTSGRARVCLWRAIFIYLFCNFHYQIVYLFKRQNSQNHT